MNVDLETFVSFFFHFSKALCHLPHSIPMQLLNSFLWNFVFVCGLLAFARPVKRKCHLLQHLHWLLNSFKCLLFLCLNLMESSKGLHMRLEESISSQSPPSSPWLSSRRFFLLGHHLALLFATRQPGLWLEESWSPICCRPRQRPCHQHLC